MLSDADFERANTDIEDNDEDVSYYVEEEVTDEEAMEKQKQELRASQKGDDPDADSDDSDMGFYMPSIIKDKSPPKAKPQKITKKIRVKKHKPTSGKKPPRQASPPLGRVHNKGRIGSTDNI